MIMDREQFRVHLKEGNRKGLPLIKMIAFKAKYVKMDQMDFETHFDNLLSVRLSNVLASEFQGKSFQEFANHKLSYYSGLRNMGKLTFYEFLDVLYDMAVPIQLDYKSNEYYTVTQLANILVAKEEDIIRQLESGRYKDAFINEQGEWLKPKPPENEY
ncbi:hypothetical protein [Paenibacillus sp. F4]|uniref:hypothetical protein n=1 Tax=Paenibacillus sp. F4 TaxID=357385 RepID=UPI000C9FA411|nr:hypothetical protein [Paenibacillus sp. F4]PNQ78888.1 hypothetical protein C1T21_22850 [Paenibacillus sp. F4]